MANPQGWRNAMGFPGQSASRRALTLPQQAPPRAMSGGAPPVPAAPVPQPEDRLGALAYLKQKLVTGGGGATRGASAAFSPGAPPPGGQTPMPTGGQWPDTAALVNKLGGIALRGGQDQPGPPPGFVAAGEDSLGGAATPDNAPRGGGAGRGGDKQKLAFAGPSYTAETEARPEAQQAGQWVTDPVTGQSAFVPFNAWPEEGRPKGYWNGSTPHGDENTTGGATGDDNALMGAVRAKIEQLLKDEPGISDEELQGEIDQILKEAEMQQFLLDQQLGARGMLASGMAGVAGGEVAGKALQSIQDLLFKNATLEEQSTTDRLGMLMQTFAQQQGIDLEAQKFAFTKEQWDQALKDQDEADLWTAAANFMPMLGAETADGATLSAIFAALKKGQSPDEIMAHLSNVGGRLMWNDAADQDQASATPHGTVSPAGAPPEAFDVFPLGLGPSSADEMFEWHGQWMAWNGMSDADKAAYLAENGFVWDASEGRWRALGFGEK